MKAKLFALAMLSHANHAFACEFHSGFSFGMHRFSSPPLAAVKQKPDLVIKMPAMLNTTDSATISTAIEFERPDEVKEAKLEISGSNKIALSTDTVTDLIASNGIIPVEFEVLETGYHLLMVKVTGMNEGSPVSYSRRVIVKHTN